MGLVARYCYREVASERFYKLSSHRRRVGGALSVNLLWIFLEMFYVYLTLPNRFSPPVQIHDQQTTNVVCWILVENSRIICVDGDRWTLTFGRLVPSLHYSDERK